MSHIKSVCVYCGSSMTSNPAFDAPTMELGRALAKEGLTLVYGGGSPGLMGKVADSCIKAGGKVIGIIPDHILKLEARHQELTELHVVENMHIRKQMMAERAEAFVILPGGFGTLDEAFEILTWKYLGIHNHPVIIANLDGFWNPLITLIEHMNKQGFVRESHMSTFTVANTIEDIIHILKTTTASNQESHFEKI